MSHTACGCGHTHLHMRSKDAGGGWQSGVRWIGSSSWGLLLLLLMGQWGVWQSVCNSRLGRLLVDRESRRRRTAGLRAHTHMNTVFPFNPRLNLAPFTKDFCGEEHYDESQRLCSCVMRLEASVTCHRPLPTEIHGRSNSGGSRRASGKQFLTSAPRVFS